MHKGKIELIDDDKGDGDNRQQITLECTECDSCFANTIDLYEHTKIHRSDLHETIDAFNLECDECHLLSATVDEYKRHMNEVHKGGASMVIRPIKCHWCGERFARIQGLYSHIRCVHTVGYPSTESTHRDPISTDAACLCTICGKFLSNAVALSTHSLIHSNAKSYKCDNCPATFRQYNTLYIHKAIHSNERKYACKECGKSFRQNAHLKTHLKTHGIGIDKWHTCNVCSKSFHTKGNLKVKRMIYLYPLPAKMLQ